MLKYDTAIEPHGASFFRSHFENKAIPECQGLDILLQLPLGDLSRYVAAEYRHFIS